MAYGIEIHNDWGKINLSTEDLQIRLYDYGEVSVPAAVGTTAGEVFVDITPLNQTPLVDFIFLGAATTIGDLSICYAINSSCIDVNGNLAKLRFENSDSAANTIRWWCWEYR